MIFFKMKNMLSKIKAIFYALAVLWIITPFDVYAVPAAPMLHTLTQPDGTTITARQWGDEWSHGWEDSDGYTIVNDKQTRHWKYAVTDIDGKLTSSARIAGRDLPPPGISKKLRPIKKAQDIILSIKQSAALPQKIVSPTGTAYIPVFLVNFSDTTTTYTPANFNTLLFGTSNWSMKDYYEEVSYGDFSVSAGPGGVTGWYTALNTHDYYGANVGSNDDDEWPGDLVYEAVKAADDNDFDFAPYDMDHDCYVDVVNIVHQGTGEEAGGPSTDIWSHSWSLNAAEWWGRSQHGEFETKSPCPSGGFIKVDNYVIQPEMLFGGQQTMGVFAHEYGHALGLPDLYDTDGSSNGVGDWSLMDSGSWNKAIQYGDRPAHFDAWSKYFLGWVDPIQVSGVLTDETIDQVEVEADPDIYKFLAGTPLSGEYFLVENRQKVSFDSALPGAGLLVWHIDGRKINTLMGSNTVNDYECYPGGPSCATNHYGVKLIQADNLWDLEKSNNFGDAGDPFPGTSNNRTFNANSFPNSDLYNSSQSNVSISNISNSGATMTATFDTSQQLAGINTTLPAEGEEYSSCSYYSPPTFQWNTNATFSKLEIQFSKDNLFTKPTKAKGIVGINQVSPSKQWGKILLMPGTTGGTVYWRVAGIKADKSVVYSNTASFIVEAPEPVSDMDISPTNKSSLPTISWENNCAKKFKIWFSSTSASTIKYLFKSVVDPLDNSGNFSQSLTLKKWLTVRNLVGDTSGSTIYWHIESWDVLKRYAKTGIESFILDP